MSGIDDDTLNGLILKAMASDSLEDRKRLYRQCYDIIADWAVDVPVNRAYTYLFLCNKIHLNMDTWTKD